jgi:metal-dependent amidase/aminoacylase/carboxypeptidase family protein
MNARTDLPALAAIRAIEDEMLGTRHQIHANPELGFEEVATSDLVAERLQRWGYQVHRGLGKTGVVGTLVCGDGPKRLGIRADMDALPIVENSGRPWASRVLGKMHACGHDGHTAMLLGAARHLAATRAFNGTLHVVFQPAEEGMGGARVMIHSGTTFNVIPETAELKLTIRALRPEVRDQLERRIKEVAHAQASVYGATAEVAYDRRCPVLVNDAAATDFARQVARDWVGEAGMVAQLPPLTLQPLQARRVAPSAGHGLVPNRPAPADGRPPHAHRPPTR